jgi:hypothetical protein
MRASSRQPQGASLLTLRLGNDLTAGTSRRAQYAAGSRAHPDDGVLLMEPPKDRPMVCELWDERIELTGNGAQPISLVGLEQTRPAPAAAARTLPIC